MRNRRPDERVCQIGEFWLSHDRKAPDVWCITWYDKAVRQTRRSSTSTTDIEQARQHLAQWVVLNTELKDERPDDIQISVVLDRYWDKHAKKLPSAASAKAGINRWKAFWKERAMSALTIEEQKRFEKWLRAQTYTVGKNTVRTISGGTVARQWNVGPTAFEWARRNQEIKWYPAVKFISDDARRERVLTPMEAAQLIDASASHAHWFRWVLISFATGARPKAVLGVTTKPEQIDLERRRINLLPPGEIQNPKKRKPILPIASTLLPWLRLWMQPENLVYRTLRKDIVRLSHLITYNANPIERFNESFDKIKEAAGIEDPLVIPYTIRHTIGTWMAEMGVPDAEREIWLGHRMPGSKTTARYVHLKPDYLKNACTSVEAFFDEVSKYLKKPIKLGPVAVQERG